jgi:flap endonuclease-1
MGITNGYTLIKDKAPGAIREAKWSDLEGEEVLIDLSIYVYKYVLIKLQPSDLYSISPKNPTINDINVAYQKIISARIESCLNGFVNMLRSVGITPIYVLDGATHPLKFKTVMARKEKIQKQVNSVNEIECNVLTVLDELDGLDDAKEYPLIEPISEFVDKVCKVPQKYLGKWAFDLAQSVLEQLDVKMVLAPYDAEGYASLLTNIRSHECDEHDEFHVEHFHHVVDDEIWCNWVKPKPFGVCTDDGDVMAFGGRHIIRKGKNYDDIVIYDINKLKDILGITQYQLVQVCILMGCDFFEGVSGYGPVNALKIIKSEKIPMVKVSKCKKHLHEVIPYYYDIIDLFMHKELLQQPDKSDYFNS